VYIDNVVMNTLEGEGLISDLAETFDNLRKFKMKLNPDKCTFGMPLGKLLGYMVSGREDEQIRICSNTKVVAIEHTCLNGELGSTFKYQKEESGREVLWVWAH
jgi:hypothetical protein